MLNLNLVKTMFEERLSGQFSDGALKNILSYYKQYIFKRSEITEFDVAKDIERILTGYPIQYLTKTASFYKYDWYVDESVLIPRSETEELVSWILESDSKVDSLLDIGMGWIYPFELAR